MGQLERRKGQIDSFTDDMEAYEAFGKGNKDEEASFYMGKDMSDGLWPDGLRWCNGGD